MLQIPTGTHAIENVRLDGMAVVDNDRVRAFQIEQDFWVIQPAMQRFDVIHINNQAAALRSGNQTYFAEFRMLDEGTLLIQLRREHRKKVYSFELCLAAKLEEVN
jgi:hypothetical protein